MTQIDLFESVRHLARRSDPVTSHEAAQKAVRLAETDEADIVRTLRREGIPLAAEQISDILGWDDHVRVNRRLSAIVEQGLIFLTEERHKNRSWRSAFKYRART